MLVGTLRLAQGRADSRLPRVLDCIRTMKETVI